MSIFLTHADGEKSRNLKSMGEHDDAVLCAMEWVHLLESIDEFGNVYPPKKQGVYRIILADCVMSFRSEDWDSIMAEWKDNDVR
jgi:hypothetical protein